MRIGGTFPPILMRIGIDVKDWEINMETLMTVDQVAEYLQVPKSYIYKLTHAKRIPFIKIGGNSGKYIRFKLSDIENWVINSQEIPQK